MANLEHLKILQKGVRAWNTWNLNQTERANLCGANLQWLSFLGANFRRTILVEVDLQGAFLGDSDLRDAHLDKSNLQGAHLEHSNLQGASLVKSNLRGAGLEKADLKEVDLNGSILREANFQDADLTGAKGLLAGQFAGANVSGAKLPEVIAKFEGLAQVEKISQQAQKLFLSLLLGCVYCWLTIATTTDVELITNSGSSPLPSFKPKFPLRDFIGPRHLSC